MSQAGDDVVRPWQYFVQQRHRLDPLDALAGIRAVTR